MGQVVDVVGRDPSRLRRGVALTDGKDVYVIKDEHIKLGTPWFHLQNINPDYPAAQWFIIEDLYELAYTKLKPDGTRMEGPKR